MSARQEADRWRCNVFDKKTRKHCMKLAASCTLHIPEARRKQSMVCGCPVMSLLAKEGPGNGELTEAPTHVSRSSAYLYDNSGGLFPDMDSRLFPVCEQPRSECQRHIGWERLFRAHSLQLCMRQKVWRFKLILHVSQIGCCFFLSYPCSMFVVIACVRAGSA